MKKVFLYKKENNEIILTDIFAMVDDEDFDRVSSNRWYLMKLYHCDTEILYARRYEGSPKNGNHRAILMHREILGVTERSQKVDHKDGNGLNNQKGNIRIGSHSENMSNRKVSYKKEVKYLGVYLNKKQGTYRVALKKDGKVYYKAPFETPELAAKGYNDLVIKYNPIYGRLNEV